MMLPRLAAAGCAALRHAALHAHMRRCPAGDEMGLGKTVQACALVRCHREEWPLLVVTPSSLRETWAEALSKWIYVPRSRMLVVYTKHDMQRVGAAWLQTARG